MKRFFSLISVFVLILAVAACSGKKTKEVPDPGDDHGEGNAEGTEQVTQEISAEEGGTIKSSDESVSIEIPAEALDSNTTITMTIYDAMYYGSTGGNRLISKIVEFEPSGTIFKKPVLISMVNNVNIENKVITAAVYNTEKGDWSYSETGVAVQITGRNEAGDPIMMSAGGDPIMLNEGGDPIMMSAGGDPIMLSAAGDPIMVTAAGDPIMNSAAGDPIMMTTGHFTAYTFIALEPEDDEKPDSGEVPDNNDDDTDDDDEDTEYADDSDEEPVIVFGYSNVVCTGQRTCGNGSDKIIECPREGDDFYGQDAQYVIRKSCVPQSFTKIEKADDDETSYRQTQDNVTGLTWLFTGKQGALYTENSVRCDELSYDGHDDWRLPSPKEFLTIANHDLRYSGYAVREAYFPELDGNGKGHTDFWTSAEGYYYSIDGSLKKSELLDVARGYMCVRGEKYGDVNTENYISLELDDGESVDFDQATQLMWGPSNNVASLKEALDFCENLDYAGYYDWRVPNKNELATLLDYPAPYDPDLFSAMLGMMSAVYMTSTSSYKNIGENSADIQPWVVDMRDGTVKIAEENSDTGSDSGFAVRCVRSKLKGPRNTIPMCDETGYMPCVSEGNIWSSRLIFANDPSRRISWEDAAQKCLDLNFNGSNQWRIPTFEELKTLVKNDDLGESVLHDYGNLVSGDAVSQAAEKVKSVNTATGEVSEFSDDYASNIVVRCVYDEMLPEPEEFPYIDYENKLVWSKVSDKEVNWIEAARYCETLDEGGSTNWKVPTLEELKKLEIDESGFCFGEEISCYPNTKGEYSVFGDLYSLWSSSFKKVLPEGEESEEEPGQNYFVVVDFLRAYHRLVDEDHSASRVRCVHKFEEETIEYPHYIEDPYNYDQLVWSYKSDFVTSIDEAQAFCSNLNTTDYGDEMYDDGEGGTEIGLDYEWYIPRLSYFLLLIKPDVCSNREELQDEEFSEESWRCREYSLSGYSEVGDIDSQIAYSVERVGGEYVKHYYLFDFLSGELTPVSDSEVAGYVRCYAGVPH
ncbi:DUF1566 domain-containing protein [bacterium]|nr:DUF1566 domain-containing protein [bacterium]